MKAIAALLLSLPWTLVASDFSCAVLTGGAASVQLEVDARSLDKNWVLTSTTCTVRFTRPDGTTKDEALSGPSDVRGGEVSATAVAYKTRNATDAVVVPPCYGKRVGASTQVWEAPSERDATGSPGGKKITLK
jgi:hypothetical protein